MVIDINTSRLSGIRDMLAEKASVLLINEFKILLMPTLEAW
jgi:hypothetical protein